MSLKITDNCQSETIFWIKINFAKTILNFPPPTASNKLIPTPPDHNKYTDPSFVPSILTRTVSRSQTNPVQAHRDGASRNFGGFSADESRRGPQYDQHNAR